MKEGVEFLNQKETDLLRLYKTEAITQEAPFFFLSLFYILAYILDCFSVVFCRRVIRSISSRQRQMSSAPQSFAVMQ